ncbi:MAG: dihydrofolate reductase [Desulfobulbus sp.]|nr:dihydrofolate reductase [Desulfobulbus sp.]
MELIIIAALTVHRVIGYHNTIPWRITEDLAHFKAVTMGFPVIMGRRTYESIGGPLSGRKTIVLTSQPDFRAHPACQIAAGLDEALLSCRKAEKVFIAGGARLYKEALPLADTLILTVISQAFPGDTYFPDFSSYPFVLTSSRPLDTAVPARIDIYRRKDDTNIPKNNLYAVG